ncbi:MAG: hypothetical protein R2865_05585 [Deinococcales bacterium]
MRFYAVCRRTTIRLEQRQFAMTAAPPVDQDELFFLMRKLEQEQIKARGPAVS